ncbi:hypothetical protein J7K74_00870 [Candidatus Woesearchaeota archaeon]|nr:hypothetical protein [Candidatus Woesearchaeota archaeon]
MSYTKRLKPSHREKKRYIVYEIKGEEFKDMNNRIIAKHLKEELFTLLGVWDSARAGIIEITQRGNRGIIRTTTKQLEKVIATLGLIRRLNEKRVRIDTIYISGTLKKAKEMLKEV